jgi:hypothetical protein
MSAADVVRASSIKKDHFLLCRTHPINGAVTPSLVVGLLARLSDMFSSSRFK